ncbi:MAG: methylthioribulose 1-phosphate dehydratase [Pseudomonadota bacterium]
MQSAKSALVSVSHRLACNGWVPATSGNFSSRIDGQSVLITASGKDKALLTEDDLLEVDLSGVPLQQGIPSAETELHLQLYRRDQTIGAVLHTHSVNGVFLSHQEDMIRFENLEILKAFPGIDSHEAHIDIPVFPNTQDMVSLSMQVETRMQTAGQGVAYLIAGHGLYTWGATLEDCVRHIEALEYLFEYQRLK